MVEIPRIGRVWGGQSLESNVDNPFHEVRNRSICQIFEGLGVDILNCPPFASDFELLGIFEAT
jgi:hypothetical protein